MKAQILIAALTSLLLFGCTTTPEEKVIGSWALVDDEDHGIVDFQKEGTFTIELKDGSENRINGTWEIIEEGKLKAKFNDLSGRHQSEICTYTIKGDSLTSSNSFGVTQTFKRIK
jgi:uncharacterized protein (TIGR03066 family)